MERGSKVCYLEIVGLGVRRGLFVKNWVFNNEIIRSIRSDKKIEGNNRVNWF